MNQAALWLVAFICSGAVLFALRWWFGEDNQLLLGMHAMVEVSELFCLVWLLVEVAEWAIPIMFGG